VDCGGRFNPAAMHWHHIDAATKESNVAAAASDLSRIRVLQEIAKCELVCANCHADRTWPHLALSSNG
jgi:hypothetical protein